jgi:hypothetical protein
MKRAGRHPEVLAALAAGLEGWQQNALPILRGAQIRGASAPLSAPQDDGGERGDGGGEWAGSGGGGRSGRCGSRQAPALRPAIIQ